MSKDLGLWPPFANTADTTHGYLACHKGAHCSGPLRVGAVGREPTTLKPLLDIPYSVMGGPPGAHALSVMCLKPGEPKARTGPPVYLSAAAMSKRLTVASR